MDNTIIYEKDRFYISNKLEIVQCIKSDGGLVTFEYTDKSTLGFYKNSTDLRKQLQVELTIGDEEEGEYQNFQFITESLDIVLSQSSQFSEKIVLILNIHSELIKKLVKKKQQLIKILQR